MTLAHKADSRGLICIHQASGNVYKPDTARSKVSVSPLIEGSTSTDVHLYMKGRLQFLQQNS